MTEYICVLRDRALHKLSKDDELWGTLLILTRIGPWEEEL